MLHRPLALRYMLRQPTSKVETPMPHGRLAERLHGRGEKRIGAMWTVRDSRYVLEDRWIKVRADACVTPRGVEIAPYYVLEYPDFVHVMAITDAAKIVLVRQYRHGFGGDVFELPGGMMEERDSSPLEAACRELREETGYALRDSETLPAFAPEPAKFANRTHLVIGSGVKVGAPEMEDGEELEVVEVDVAATLRMIVDGRFSNIAHAGMIVVGALRRGLVDAAHIEALAHPRVRPAGA
jgi:8-oxo-dGTP pyrophosphatase MutT (NUDIX family)